jgi:ABC-type transport system involved in multi-copper enzyme maturation permease subunit
MNTFASSRLGTIARYEILMAWRRRSLPILWILLLVGVVGFALLVDNANQMILDSVQERVEAGLFTMEQFNTNLLFSTMVAAMIFYSIGVTLLMGEVIPLDAQFKVRELLGTLPVSRATYLGGKLFGVWGGLVLGWLVIGVIGYVVLRLIIGAFDWRVFLLLWLLLPLLATLTSGALSMLICALVGSRRAAVFVGLLVLPFAFYLNAMSVVAFVNLTVLIDPIYTYGSPLIPSNGQIVIDAVRGLLNHILVIAVTWGIVLFFVNRRELR